MTEHRLSTRPLYLQLREALLERIAAGQWKAGNAIPNEADLAREFGVSPGTMRKALDLLEAQRVLTRRQGRGTFVNDQNSAELALRYSKLRDRDGRPILGEVVIDAVSENTASPQEASHLGLAPQARVYRYRRSYRHEGHPFMLDEGSVAAELFPGLETETEVVQDVVARAQRYGIVTGHATERISLGTADQARADALSVAPGTPLLIFDRVVYQVNGLPLEWRLAFCHLA